MWVGVAVKMAAETAADTAAARSDSGVDVGWSCDELATAKTREADGVRGGSGGVGGCGGGGGGGGGKGGGGGECWSLAASTARCSSAPLQRSCGSCSICSQMR